MKQEESKPVFSFEPHKQRYNPIKKEIEIVERMDYIILGNLSFGDVYYTPRTNQYWAAPGKEMTAKRLEEFLPYLSWDYDQIEEQTEFVEATGKDGKKKLEKVGTGIAINAFPPSPDNIAKKRQELIEEAVKGSKEINYVELYAKTSPRSLKLDESDRKRLVAENSSHKDLLINRLNRTTR